MTPSPDLIRELEAARPTAPLALRARVREIAAGEQHSPASQLRRRFRLPARRLTLVALPAAAALAFATAGVVGLARSDSDTTALDRIEASKGVAEESAPATANTDQLTTLAQDPIGPTTNRVQQVNATLTVEVDDSDGVSAAAQEALALTRRLGGHVVTTTVLTGRDANANLTVRVPVAKVQEAIVGLSALGTIVSQQVRIDDLQESVDAFERRQRSLRNQIAVVVARLEGSLDAETRARLEQRLKNLRTDLRGARTSEANVRALGRMATLQLGVVTSDSGEAAPGSRLDRTLDGAVDVLVWEGVVALAILIVVAPFALVALLAWLGRRFYRRREEDRLLAT